MNIDWTTRRILGNGCNGVVYKVGDKAVKVGLIWPIEVAMQCYFAAKNAAPPIYYYREQEELPTDVIKELCSTHKTVDLYYQKRHKCIVNNAADILIMGIAYTSLNETEELRQFTRSIYDECCQVFGIRKDMNPSNVGYYKDHYVALDFGL